MEVLWLLVSINTFQARTLWTVLQPKLPPKRHLRKFKISLGRPWDWALPLWLSLHQTDILCMLKYILNVAGQWEVICDFVQTFWECNILTLFWALVTSYANHTYMTNKVICSPCLKITLNTVTMKVNLLFNLPLPYYAWGNMH